MFIGVVDVLVSKLNIHSKHQFIYKSHYLSTTTLQNQSTCTSLHSLSSLRTLTGWDVDSFQCTVMMTLALYIKQ